VGSAATGRLMAAGDSRGRRDGLCSGWAGGLRWWAARGGERLVTASGLTVVSAAVNRALLQWGGCLKHGGGVGVKLRRDCRWHQGRG
jgi:hypothetical protein